MVVERGQHGPDPAEVPLSDAHLADLSRDDADRRRRGWLLMTLGILVLALATCVPLALRPGASGDSSDGIPPGDATSLQAGVYVAALSGGPRPHRLTQRIYVSARECGDVATAPRSVCAGRPIPVGVQARVRAVLGGNVVFRQQPGRPATNGGVPVASFGHLRVHARWGLSTAHLPMQTTCGTLCGQGQTLVLRWHEGVWQVSGATGPQWIS